MLKYLLISVRPSQWYKNSLLLAGIVFSANILNISMWAKVGLACVYFCMLSASEYLINDVLDRERDKRHPVKSRRPIASGKVAASHAVLFASLLIVLSLVGAYLTMSLSFLVVSASYSILIFLYSLILKHHIIADVLVISLGFVIRAVAGCLAIDVSISPWLIVCTFLLALFLALEKRWHELYVLASDVETHRPILSEYSPRMLEQLVSITNGAVVVSYLMYAFLAGNDAMLFTTPFVIYGLFRYMYLVHERHMGNEPEVVFRDKAMIIDLGIWSLLVVSIVHW